MVGDEMAVGAAGMQQLRHGVVERLERSPAAVQKAQAAGQHVAARRHARQAADIVLVETETARGEPVEVRRRNTTSAIGAKQMAVERIEQDKDGLHDATSGSMGR
jgi:hypothetical protein